MSPHVSSCLHIDGVDICLVLGFHLSALQLHIRAPSSLSKRRWSPNIGKRRWSPQEWKEKMELVVCSRGVLDLHVSGVDRVYCELHLSVLFCFFWGVFSWSVGSAHEWCR